MTSVETGLKIFEKPEFGSVRVVEKDGDPWFVAKDVCDCLEVGNSRDAVATLDEDEKGVATIDTLGGAQEMATISESGLYSLILRSRKPEAKTFKRWIVREVLPSIRKTGSYGNGILMPNFTDPLASIATLGAYPSITTTPDGTRYITLTYSRASTHKSQRKAQAIVTRFERLIILQLDVPDGHNQRTVQQLVASRRVLVADGRYLLGK